MNRAEQKQLSEIIDLWSSCESKMTAQSEIARQGPTIESKFYEFEGDFPQNNGPKPEVISGKVDKMRKIVISKEERTAFVAVSAIPDRPRKILTGYKKYGRRWNPIAQRPYTHDDIAEMLRLPPARYRALRDMLGQLVLEVAKSQDVDSEARKVHSILIQQLAFS